MTSLKFQKIVRVFEAILSLIILLSVLSIDIDVIHLCVVVVILLVSKIKSLVRVFETISSLFAFIAIYFVDIDETISSFTILALLMTGFAKQAFLKTKTNPVGVRLSQLFRKFVRLFEVFAWSIILKYVAWPHFRIQIILLILCFITTFLCLISINLILIIDWVELAKNFCRWVKYCLERLLLPLYFLLIVFSAAQTWFSTEFLLLIPDIIVCSLLLHFRGIVGCKKRNCQDEELNLSGAYVNGSNGVRLHINCTAKTKIVDIRIIMAEMWRVKINNVFLFHHRRRLSDSVEIGGDISLGLLSTVTAEAEPERIFNKLKMANPKQANRRQLDKIFYMYQIHDSVINEEL